MPFNREERIFILKAYMRSQSYQQTQNEFTLAFPGRAPPNKSAISRLYAKFNDTGSVLNVKHDRVSTVLTCKKMEEVATLFAEAPRTSLRKAKQVVGVSYGSVQRATKKLKLTPYKLHVVHELLPADPARRLHYCTWYRQFTRNNIARLDTIFFSDEAWFSLNGYVNSQNYRWWSSVNPYGHIEAPLHSEKIGVWCALSRKRLVGPIFFTTTITAEVYQGILTDFIALLERDERYCWFQQDNARPHTAKTTKEFLLEFFDNRLIWEGLWPPRSPDLSPLDFFLWGYIKDRAYVNQPATLDDLKTNITQIISEIPESMLTRVMRNSVKRAKACLDAQGAHFEHLL